MHPTRIDHRPIAMGTAMKIAVHSRLMHQKDLRMLKDLAIISANLTKSKAIMPTLQEQWLDSIHHMAKRFGTSSPPASPTSPFRQMFQTQGLSAHIYELASMVSEHNKIEEIDAATIQSMLALCKTITLTAPDKRADHKAAMLIQQLLTTHQESLSSSAEDPSPATMATAAARM